MNTTVINPSELGQPGFEIRSGEKLKKVSKKILDPNVMSFASWEAFNKGGNRVDYSTPSQEARKTKILTELYNTGRIDGLYFGRASKSEANPIRHYIKCCLYKNFIKVDSSLVDDCYNEMFVHLWKKTAADICAMYDESPKKVTATALKIIALKCFAIDPRYNNPKHSLVQSILFSSNKTGENISLHHAEVQQHGDNIDYQEQGEFHALQYNQIILKDNSADPSEFCRDYGFEVEDLVDRLTEGQKMAFYERIGKQPRGKVSAAKQADRDELDGILKSIRKELSK